ncbi:MAG: sugar phosphate isomerase/epimerase family protein, partial [Candidatus Hermodarchaeota archaeon]
MYRFKPIALNQNTCEKLDILKFIKFAYKCKFDGIELRFEKIKSALSEKVEIRDILDVLERYNLKVNSICPLEDFSLSSDSVYKSKVLKIFEQMISYCNKLGTNLVVVQPSFIEKSTDGNSIPKWRIIKRTANKLEDLCKKAYREDVNIGFEFIVDDLCSISNLSDAKEVVKSLEHQENLGYIIETLYFAMFNVDFNQLYDIKDFLYLIKLTDYLEHSESNPKRILPSEGNFNFSQFYNYLRKIKYNKI